MHNKVTRVTIDFRLLKASADFRLPRIEKAIDIAHCMPWKDDKTREGKLGGGNS